MSSKHSTPLKRLRRNTISMTPASAPATPASSLESLKALARKQRSSSKKSSKTATNDSPSSRTKRKSRQEGPVTPRGDKKKKRSSEAETPPSETGEYVHVDTPRRLKRSNTLSKMGGALRRGLSKTFSKKRVNEPTDETRRKTAGAHELLASAAALSGRFWGAPLEPLREAAGDDARLPKMHSFVLDWLRQHALTVEGIFRRSPDQGQFVRLRNYFETKGVAQEIPAETDPYLVGNLLKTLIGELPGTVLTRGAFGAFADAVLRDEDAQDDDALAEELRSLVDALPAVNAALLVDMFAIFVAIGVRNVEETKMTSSNLATCISPNFVTPLQENFAKDQSSLLEAYKIFHRMTKIMIDKFDVVFVGVLESSPFAKTVLAENAMSNPKSPTDDEKSVEKQAALSPQQKKVTVEKDGSSDEAAHENEETQESEFDATQDEFTDDAKFTEDDFFELQFASPSARIAALPEEARATTTFVYVNDIDTSNNNNVRLERLLARQGVHVEIEWQSELQGELCVEDAVRLLVRGDDGMRATRLLVSSADKIEQHDVCDIDDAKLTNFLTASDGKCVSPLVVHNSCLFVGLNEQIWELKIRA